MAVIQEACVHGVSTRSVDDLVKAMGAGGMSKRRASRPCAEIDERVNAFLSRPLEGAWPYLRLDATYLKRGGRLRILPPRDIETSEPPPGQDPRVLRAIGRAWGWRQRMDRGEITTIADSPPRRACPTAISVAS